MRDRSEPPESWSSQASVQALGKAGRPLDARAQIAMLSPEHETIGCPGGGIGRRARLRIWSVQTGAGSIPVPGTISPVLAPTSRQEPLPVP